jgi:hypothetical protein
MVSSPDSVTGEVSGSNSRASRSLFRHPIFVAAVLLTIVGFVQLWLNTAGQLWLWPRYTIYYPALTDAFLHGQLSLRIKPPPQLLALPDPYDPIAAQRYRWHDVALYHGNYYLYWGPVPALVAAAVCLVSKVDVPDYYDQQLAFAFTLGIVVFATVLMLQARSKLFPRLGAWFTLVPVLSLGLGAPALILGGVYGAAIAAGQCFLLAGMCAAWRGLSSDRAGPFWLGTAGICWALSGGSRVSLPPALAIITALTLGQIWRQKRDRSPWLAAVALVIPLLIGAGLYGWYNFARFHSITEFGERYQLAATNQHKNPLSDYSSPRFMVVNLYRYMLTLPIVQKTFPFFLDSEHRPAIASLFKLPSHFGTDPLVGLIWVQPLLFLAVFAAAPARQAPSRSLQRWLTRSLATGAVVGFVPSLSISGSTWRYMMDVVPSCAVLAGLGYAWMIDTAGPRRRWIEAAAILLVLGQSVLGILLMIHYDHDTFEMYNPDLYNAMASFFNHL